MHNPMLRRKVYMLRYTIYILTLSAPLPTHFGSEFIRCVCSCVFVLLVDWTKVQAMFLRHIPKYAYVPAYIYERSSRGGVHSTVDGSQNKYVKLFITKESRHREFGIFEINFRRIYPREDLPRAPLEGIFSKSNECSNARYRQNISPRLSLEINDISFILVMA